MIEEWRNYGDDGAETRVIIIIIITIIMIIIIIIMKSEADRV